MNTFSRYLFRQVSGALLLILLSLAGVVWIALALRELDLVTTEGQNAWVFVIMTTLALPNLIALIAPIALLIATIHTLNRLSGDSELIVLTASGASIWTVARPLLVLALLVAIAVSFVNHIGMPWSLQLLRAYVIEVHTDLISKVLQPGQFSSPERNLTIHIRDRTYNGELRGILLQDARDAEQTMAYLADRGVLMKQDESTFLVMFDGHIVRKTDDNEAPQIVTFESYAIDLNRFEPKSEGVVLKPRERYFSDLAWPDPDDPYARHRPGHLRAELHERLSGPLYPFAFVMIALAFVGQARSTRQGRMEGLVMAFLVAAMIRLGGLAANNLVAIRASTVPLLYLLPLGGIVLSYAVIRMNARPRGGPTVSDRIAQLVSNGRALTARWVPARPVVRAARRQGAR